ncbi:MAG: hypothetical protein FJ306_11210 [Planctomycetes bacterium]|nr:hypothetical protein [Planctomycetota bacterium]
MRGRLLGSDGLPLRHVTVRISTPADARYVRDATATTDGEGRFIASMLPILPFPDAARTTLVFATIPSNAPPHHGTLPHRALPPGEIDLGDLQLAVATRRR